VVAVKVLLTDDAATRRTMEREAGVLALLRHSNLLLFIGFCAHPRPAILSEFMQRGRRAGRPLALPHTSLFVSSCCFSKVHCRSEACCICCTGQASCERIYLVRQCLGAVLSLRTPGKRGVPAMG